MNDQLFLSLARQAIKDNLTAYVQVIPLALKPDYLDVIVDWNLKEWGSQWRNAKEVTTAHYKARLNKDKTPIAFVAVLHWQGQEVPVGSLSLVDDVYGLLPKTKNGSETYWRSRAIIEQNFRGLGIGTMLRAKLDEFARQQGIHELNSFIIEGEESRLYLHAVATGWQPIAEFDGDKAKGIDKFGYSYDFGHIIILRRLL